MDIFLIGFGPLSPGEAEAALEVPGSRLIRDWSSLTDDDTSWSVVVDVPGASSARTAADELGLEVRGLMRLVPDHLQARPSGDWVTKMVEVLPSDPPPPLGDLIRGYETQAGPQMTLLPDGEACDVCGWIGGHNPKVGHPYDGR